MTEEHLYLIERVRADFFDSYNGIGFLARKECLKPTFEELHFGFTTHPKKMYVINLLTEERKMYDSR